MLTSILRALTILLLLLIAIALTRPAFQYSKLPVERPAAVERPAPVERPAEEAQQHAL